MSRYIDANEKLTITVYDDEHEENIDHYMTIEEILDTYTSEGCPPTADVVEIVRCKDCVYWEQATDNSGNCNRAFEITAYEGDYCSYGERREDDEG